MKSFYIFNLFLMSHGLMAQDLSQIVESTPQCALTCVLRELPPAGLTSLNDTLCTNVTLQSQISTCVQKSCKFSDQLLASQSEISMCAKYPKQSKSNEILLVASIMSAVVFPVVILKFYTRWAASNSLWADDFAAMVASIFLLIIASIEIASAKLGLGTHYWFISAGDGVILLKLFYAAQISYIMIQVAAKSSLLFLYLRVFTRPWFKMACKIGIVFLITHGSGYIMVIIFQCRPITSIWNKQLTGKCVDLTAVGLSGAVFSIIEDLVILILPIPECKNIQMGKKKKWGLALMFAVGSFACVTSMVRLRYVLQFANTFDSTWDNTDVVKWSLIEEFTAVLCACLPSLRVFFVHTFTFFHSSFRSFTSGNRSKSSSDNSAPSHQLSNLNDRKKMEFSESTTELSPFDENKHRGKDWELDSPSNEERPKLISKYNERKVIIQRGPGNQ